MERKTETSRTEPTVRIGGVALPALPYALFDMDGTLVDSMYYWKQMPAAFLAERGQTISPADQARIEASRGYAELLTYFASRGVTCTLSDILSFVTKRMAQHYAADINAKKHTCELLTQLRVAGTQMGIITMTPHADVDICLERTGLAPYFSFVLTPEDMPHGSGKEDPAIFREALRRLGCARAEDCLFFEDSCYAIETAADMGFYTVGVADPYAAFERERILARVSAYIDLDAAGAVDV